MKTRWLLLHFISTIPTKNCIPQVGEQFFRDKSGDELKQAIYNRLQVQPDVIDSEQIKINRFAENEKDSIKRWHRLSRLLDGKRIMHRIDDLLFSGKVKLESERGVLAGYIAKHKLIDPALTNWLEGVYFSAA